MIAIGRFVAFSFRLGNIDTEELGEIFIFEEFRSFELHHAVAGFRDQILLIDIPKREKQFGSHPDWHRFHTTPQRCVCTSEPNPDNCS